jgi:hypothetical protein
VTFTEALTACAEQPGQLAFRPVAPSATKKLQWTGCGYYFKTIWNVRRDCPENILYITMRARPEEQALVRAGWLVQGKQFETVPMEVLAQECRTNLPPVNA